MDASKVYAYAATASTVVYRLALPFSIIVAGYLVYLGMTRPYDECVQGKISAVKSWGYEPSIDQAKYECYGKR